jgi:hypothetical protein
MELLLEVILGTLGEILLQSVGQALFELGFYSVVDVFQRKKKRDPYFTALGYLLWGCILGGLSLLVFPKALITRPEYRVLNLIVVPLAAGYAMAVIGAWRRKKAQEPLRLDSFSYGALFAFATAVVRFVWAA